jgi:aminotransferase
MKISQPIENMIAAPVDRINAVRLDLEAQGLSIVNLGQAIPDFPPPGIVNRTVLDALQKPNIHRYTADPGLPELRGALARFLGAQPEEIIVTAGANHAFLLACTALLEKNEQFCVLSPFFLNHRMTVEGCGGTIREILPDNGFTYPMDQVEQAIAAPRVRALVIVNPSNPTGKVFSREELQAMLKLCKKHRVWLICDEVYGEFVYPPAQMVSAGSLPGASEITVIMGSFSKAFGMTGGRIGWLRAPGVLIPQLLKVQDYSIICAPHISQAAALAAITRAPGWPASHLDDLAQRREELTTVLQKSGLFTIYQGDGAFFTWFRPACDVDSEVEIYEMKKKAGVCLMPGYLFGENWRSWFRISYGTQPIDKLREAAERIIAYFAAPGGPHAGAPIKVMGSGFQA